MKNLQGMLQRAQALQAKISAVQDELKLREVVGSASGGAVKITMNGAQEVVGVSIDPGAVNPEEADLLEDLVLAAFRDARAKVTRMVEEEMSRVTGGLGLPPGIL